MKKFWECVLEWKTYAALLFAGSVILCVVIFVARGENSVPISVLVSLAVISSIGTLLQFIAFTGHIIKKMRYTIRMVVFLIPFFSLLAANAWVFRWFPLDAGHWLTFCIVFLVVFAGMTAGFEIYFHAMGKKYDGLLGEYRKKKELENLIGVDNS